MPAFAKTHLRSAATARIDPPAAVGSDVISRYPLSMHRPLQVDTHSRPNRRFGVRERRRAPFLVASCTVTGRIRPVRTAMRKGGALTTIAPLLENPARYRPSPRLIGFPDDIRPFRQFLGTDNASERMIVEQSFKYC
ncbi:hypothetical protein [Paraburkholderia heleia]|uniref:hypothetical protein n=1 Tax=Paraburkholderia heleia TaxID=634127 RepID=UPI0031D29136